MIGAQFRGDDGKIWTVLGPWALNPAYHDVRNEDGKMSLRRTSDLRTSGIADSLPRGAVEVARVHDEVIYEVETLEDVDRVSEWLERTRPPGLDPRALDSILALQDRTEGDTP